MSNSRECSAKSLKCNYVVYKKWVNLPQVIPGCIAFQVKVQFYNTNTKTNSWAYKIKKEKDESKRSTHRVSLVIAA